MFCVTYYHHTHCAQGPESDPLSITVKTIARVPALLIIILDVIVRTVRPALKCHYVLADVLRMTSDLAWSLLHYCMASTFPAAPAVRLHCITSIITATAPLRRVPEWKSSLGSLPQRTLHIRLEYGSMLDWSAVDTVLQDVFRGECDLPISRELVHSAAVRLGNNCMADTLPVRFFLFIST